MTDNSLEVYSVKEVAAILKTTRQQVRKMIQNEELTAVKVGREWRVSSREPRKVCVKENKRHPFSQESEQEMNLIERKYYNGTDTEGNAESIRGQPKIQQHHRDHGRDERDVPGRIAAGDGKRTGCGAGVRKKSAHVGNGCRKQAAKLSQRALEKDGKDAVGGGGSKNLYSQKGKPVVE